MLASPLRLAVVVCAVASATGCGGRLERAPDAAAAPAGGAAADTEPPAESPVEGGFSSEAERTRAMEAQAEELQQQFKESMAGAATEEEKLRAYQEFEQGRQELDEIAEDDLGDDDDAYAPPPRR